MKFKAAIDTVTVERGLSNVKGFKQKYQKAFNTMHPAPHIAFGNKKLPKPYGFGSLYGGRWRARTADILRVKQASAARR